MAYLPASDELVGEGIGHFLGALRIDAFRPADEFKSHMDKWIDRFHKAKPVAGQKRVLVPGDPEAEIIETRKADGIPLLEPVVRDLLSLADKFGLEF